MAAGGRDFVGASKEHFNARIVNYLNKGTDISRSLSFSILQALQKFAQTFCVAEWWKVKWKQTENL